MKRLFSLLTMAVMLVVASCGDKTEKTAGDNMSSDKKVNSMAEKNIAAVHAVTNAFGTGDLAALDSVVADDFVDHTYMGDKVGRDSLKAAITMVRADSKNMKMETIKELADDTYVMTWVRFTGESKGAMGKPGPYDMHGLEITRLKDGKVSEHWEYVDGKEMMAMMPQPTPAKTKAK